MRRDRALRSLFLLLVHHNFLEWLDQAQLVPHRFGVDVLAGDAVHDDRVVQSEKPELAATVALAKRHGLMS